MTRLYNRKFLKGNRRALRRRMTFHERQVWYFLRKQQTGYRFRRQFSIGRYIVDFYCPQTKLAIELDGSGHADARRYDAQRTHDLMRYGVCVKRYTNTAVWENCAGVVEDIVRTCDGLAKREPHPFPPLIKGRGRS